MTVQNALRALAIAYGQLADALDEAPIGHRGAKTHASGPPTHSDVRNWAAASPHAPDALLDYVSQQEAAESERDELRRRVEELEKEVARQYRLLDRAPSPPPEQPVQVAGDPLGPVTHPGCAVCGNVNPPPMFNYAAKAWLCAAHRPQPQLPGADPVEADRPVMLGELVEALRDANRDPYPVDRSTFGRLADRLVHTASRPEHENALHGAEGSRRRGEASGAQGPGVQTDRERQAGDLPGSTARFGAQEQAANLKSADAEFRDCIAQMHAAADRCGK